MRGWVALLLAAGLLAVAGVWANGDDASPEAVLSAPDEGERGHYETTHLTHHPDGSTERATGEHVVTWSQETVDVPGGEERALPSFTYTFPPPEDTDEETATALGLLEPTDGGVIDEHQARLAFHYTDLGDGAALTTSERVVDDTENGDVHVFQRVARQEGDCAGQRTAWLVDRPPAAAEAAIASCLAEHLRLEPDEVGTTSTWASHPDHGRVWVLEAEAVGATPDKEQQRARLELVASPVLALELRETLVWTEPTPEGPVEHRYTERLVGYDGGEDGLAAHAAPLAPPPTVPITAWKEDGPEQGDAEAYPFAQAREDAQAHPRSAAFHDEHPEATLYKATFVDRSRESATERTAPRGCEPAGKQTPSPATGHEVPQHGWRFHWTGDGEHLVASVDRPQTSGPVDEVLASPDRHASAFPAEGPLPGLELPREGPSLASLWGHVDRLDPDRGQATPFVRVQAPWHGDADDPLVGVAGHLSCQRDPVTGEVELTETGVRFVDGELEAAFRMVFRDEGYTAFDAADLQPPGDDERDEGWSPPALGLAGVAIVAGGLTASAASRAASSLYSRLTGREVLEHDTRRQLLDAVIARPGTTLDELSRQLDVHRATAEHHLEILDREDWIALVRAPAGIVALPAGHPLGEDAAVLARAGARSILEHLDEHPGANVTALARALDVSRGHASRLVSELVDAGLLDRTREGRSVRLSLTELGSSAVG